MPAKNAKTTDKTATRKTARTPKKGARKAKAAKRERPSLLRRALLWTWAGLTAAAAVALAFGLYHFLYVSDFFKIRDIEVVGAELYDEAELIEQTGIATGDNLWQTSLRGAATAVEALPWIRSAEVVREYPDRILLRVQEREPVLRVQEPGGGENWVVDTEAVLLNLKHLKNDKIAIARDRIYDTTLTGVALDPFIHGAAIQLPALSEFLALWNEQELFTPLREVRLNGREIVLHPRERVETIHLGPNDIRRQLEGLAVLWESLKREGLTGEYIDLRYPRQGIVARLDNVDDSVWQRLRSAL